MIETEWRVNEMMMTPILAFLPGGGGPLMFPLLLLVGFYVLNNQIARVTCFALLTAWLLWYSAYAVFSAEWHMLTFPALIITAWSLISGINKSVG
jgi:hypothetical protein